LTPAIEANTDPLVGELVTKTLDTRAALKDNAELQLIVNTAIETMTLDDAKEP